jgi:transcriptional regulator with XRE-family HTH domain
VRANARPNGEAIRAIRTANQCGLRELARRAGLNPGFLSLVETGQRGASKQTIAAIADALPTTVEAITEPEPTP